MSELVKTRNADFRWGLLTSVSTLALLAFVGVQEGSAAEDDSDRPTVWIELGGQFEQQTGQGDSYVPDFITNNAALPAFKGINFMSQKGKDFSNGFEGKLSFQPTDSNWIFSASFLYGRANGHKSLQRKQPGPHLHHKSLYFTYRPPTPSGYKPRVFHCCVTVSNTPTFQNPYANLQSNFGQAHTIVDFQAGKDFGLGMFGRGGSSVISGGVRFAQFTSKASSTIQALPVRNYEKRYKYYDGFTYSDYRRLPTHRYAMTESDNRSFRGVGPAISWNASAPILGNPQRAEIDLDWGVNAAVLFGRQRVAGIHQTLDVYNAHYSTTQSQHSGEFGRARTVIVPNVGGFAGISFRYAAAKVSFGYRGDFFFGAMDAGNDTRKTKTVGFYGPFATLGIGIGG